MEIQEEKRDLRQRILKELEALSPDEKREQSAEIQTKIEADKRYQEAKSVMFYVSKAEEVDTHALIQHALGEGKNVIVPFVEEKAQKIVPVQIFEFPDDLILGKYGILEPLPDRIKDYAKDEIEVIFVPGVAFDASGNRLGRGLGYYDRFLAALPAPPLLVGLVFKVQSVEQVPTTPHDISVDVVITNE